MNSHAKYVKEDDKNNVKLENVYSEESVSNLGKVNGEYFEEDDKTNVKIEEKGYTGKKYPCNWCVYKATTKGSLKTHVQSVHENIKYSCNQCDHQATEKGNLKRHIQSLHEKIKY